MKILKEKVYTFFEPIDKWDSSRLLVDLWVENWSSKGFDPVVLSESDAKSHPYYNEYSKLIKSNFKKMTGDDICSGEWGKYIYYCFIRHLAYANKMTNRISLAMDYDIYNINYSAEKSVKNKIVGLSFKNPCCLSGNKKLFLKLCLLMSKFTEKNINEYKASKENYHRKPPFHDLGWVHYTLNLPTDLSYRLQEIADFSKNILKGHEAHEGDKQLIHVSFFWLKRYMEDRGLNYEILSNDERLKFRYKLAKEQLYEL